MIWYPNRAAKAHSPVISGQRRISPAIRRIPETPSAKFPGGESISRAFFARASGTASGRGRSGPSGRTMHQRFSIGYGGTEEERDNFNDRTGTFWGSSRSESDNSAQSSSSSNPNRTIRCPEKWVVVSK